MRIPRVLFFFTIVTSSLLLGCERAQVSPPARPDGVPASAIWAGGIDGGVFIDCAPGHNGEPTPCTVYNDYTGDIYMSGRFVLQGQTRGARADELKYEGADGTRIYLENDLVFDPVPPKKPASVPKTALLAENGVYVDCQPSRSGVYKCALFLAADGQNFLDGDYRCDESLSVPCTEHIPKIADRSEINLQNGAVLKIVK
jgi:hypothetical protein